MPYNACCGVYEKTLWLKLGLQFKFKVNGENKVSAFYPVAYVISLCAFSALRMRKGFKTTCYMIVSHLSNVLCKTQRSFLKRRSRCQRLSWSCCRSTWRRILMTASKVQRPLIKTRNVMFSHSIIDLFFSSVVNTEGDTKNVYFLESGAIGVNCSSSSIIRESPLFSHGAEDLGNDRVRSMHDSSLFVNNSEGSFEELEMLSKDLELSDHKDKLSGIAVLSEDELVCEADGKVTIVCIRLTPAHEPEVLSFITGEDKHCSCKIRVVPSDLVLIFAGENIKTCKERVKKMVRRKELGSAATQRIAKEVMESVGKGMVIVGRVCELV
eukprot:TRINITY_DN879_c0_g1_i10.p1 TRINITY_DN879_c0_g1~~TRINITY_DN879_c0_g1_i10.p1  ORF type:complete len:325 (-),score=50.73 TRINITY_DN879_c0_g1_i10:125-1099(-)